MRRLLFRGIAGVLLLVVAVGIAATLVLRASLPQLDGKIAVAGLGENANIARDSKGIPVITASSRADLAFATGFAHGQDRFFQMDMIRRKAAGELSEIIGAIAVDADRRYRFHRFRSKAQAVLDNAAEADRVLLAAYAEGVNSGLGSLGARPFEYFVLGAEPEPWSPADSVLVVFAMYLELNDSRATKEVQRGLAHRVLSEEVYAWLYPQGTPWDAPIMGGARAVAAIPDPAVYSVRDKPDNASSAREAGRYPLRGSNNWAVSGALTANGRAIVSNDMHLGLNTPNIYYQARLVVDGLETYEVAGVTLPGAPFVIAGSNTQVAWGYTNSYGDWTDAVVLKPGSAPDTYKTPQGDRKFTVHRESIKVKDSDPVTYLVRETIWGPVLDDTDYPDGEIAVSWVAHRPEGVNLRLIDLEKAESVSAALDIANTMSMPPQNFVTGDADGNIGWTIAGRIPRKTDFNAMLPADWSEQQGWQGWLDSDEYPRVENPQSGRIWTANARVTDADALRVVGDGGYDLGARASQIRDALFAVDTFSPEDMLAIQYDDRALFLARWRDLLLKVLDDATVADDADLAEYRRLANEWIPRADPASVGYRLVRAFRLEVEKRVFEVLMAPVREAYGDDVKLRRSNQFEAPLWALVTAQPLHMLPSNYADWHDFMVTAVRQNIDYMNETYEGPLSRRTWGEINTAAIRHPLSRSIPLVGDLLDMPADALSGDLDMPKAQGPSFGASERFSVAPGDEANSILNMPTGQSGHPLSRFYSRGHEDWVQGRPSPFLPGPAEHRLTLTPAGL
ncbi:MAG: penicillin acylase family protein [Gammaproteobacteria bacterium]|nr:penicillin acylase family protein [Gammaproteobacteria bacterium]NND48089.1 penicillin acylase family protein [Woeseiaceae bacterium]NNL45869.1 penicillin acylase family protein [Woeseiaceae bacterium]